MQITSSAFDYNTAIRNAVKAAASEGTEVLYPSGHRDKLDVAVRRAVLTGVGQTCRELSETNAQDMGCDLMKRRFRGLNNYEVGDIIIVYHSDLDIYYSNLEIISREFDVVIRGDNAVAENVDIEIGTFKNAISRSAYMSNTVYRESEKRIPEIISRLEALESTTTEEV